MSLSIRGIKQFNGENEAICTYTPSVKTYNIVTDKMSDDCSPVSMTDGVCMWVDSEGALGEIECIYPRIYQNNIVPSIDRKIVGVPLFEDNNISLSSIYIQELTEGFIIWFSDVRDIEFEVSQNNISYFITTNQLVGILAKNHQIID